MDWDASPAQFFHHWEARETIMKQNCQHCGELIVGNTYRVTSEEAGVSLLDMIVCSLCSVEAKKLRLRTQRIDVTRKQISARTRGTYAFTTRYLI